VDRVRVVRLVGSLIGEHHRELPVEVALGANLPVDGELGDPSMPVNIARAVSRNSDSAAEPCSWARRNTTVYWMAMMIFFLDSWVALVMPTTGLAELRRLRWWPVRRGARGAPLSSCF
jgi:hypothetical protein